MKLAELSWPEIATLDREIVVMIPTGSIEQHGPHMPLMTDTALVTAVAEAVEADLADTVLLTPTLWLGASAHHLGFAGSLSATYDGYVDALTAVVDSLAAHSFRRFFLINGHGGNNSSNDIAARSLKAKYPTSEFCATNYWSGIDGVVAATLEGPLKSIRHACEGETSLMLHVRPGLVKMDRAQTDGLVAENGPQGAVRFFDEVTERGNFGYSALATEAKGRVIFEAAVAEMAREVVRFASPAVLAGLDGLGE